MENEVIVQKKLWTASFVLIILVNFFVYVGNFMLMSTLPLHILNIGGNKIMAGLIVGIYSLTGFISRLQVGSLLDQKGRNLIMFAGLIILFLVNVSYIAASYSVIMLLMLRAIHGIGWSATTTSTSTMASDIIPAARRMDGMGFLGISISIAMVIGPGLGLYIMEHYNDMVLFSFSACFIVVALLIGFLKIYHYQCKEDIKIIITDKSAENTVGKNKKVVIERTVLWPSFLFFIIVMTYSTIMIFLPAYAKYKGVTDSGAFFIIMALAMIITRLVIGRIVDRYGMEKVVVGAMVLLATSLHLLFIVTSLPMFLVAAVIYGLGYGAVQPALNALVISLAPVERRGAANATFLCAMDMGGILGAVVWGSVAQAFGFIYIYSASTVLIILSVILYLVAFRRKLNL